MTSLFQIIKKASIGKTAHEVYYENEVCKTLGYSFSNKDQLNRHEKNNTCSKNDKLVKHSIIYSFCNKSLLLKEAKRRHQHSMLIKYHTQKFEYKKCNKISKRIKYFIENYECSSIEDPPVEPIIICLEI